MKVLIVEDDPTMQQMIALMLSVKDIPCEVVNDGVAALEAWERGEFGLILMDVQMPVMDGLEATRRIRDQERSRGGRIPIIALTAHALPGDQAKCLAAGVDEHLPKPIDFDRFYWLLERFGADSRGQVK